MTPALRQYIEAKVVKPVEKLVKRDTAALLDLEFSRTTRHHRKGKVFRAEANLSFGKSLVRAEAEEEDVRVACDVLKEELGREIGSFKEKRGAKEKRNARRLKQELRFGPAAR